MSWQDNIPTYLVAHIDAIIGVIGVVIGVFFGLFSQALYGHYYRPNIQIKKEADSHSSITEKRHRVIVENKGKSTAEDCVGYITIDIGQDDVLPDKNAFIENSKNYTPIKDEGLCWSFNEEKQKNPHYLSIFPNTHKLLELYHVEIVENELYIKIPSELGWEPKFRVKLKAKKYEGTLKIAARNVVYDENKHAKKFKLEPSKWDVTLTFDDC